MNTDVLGCVVEVASKLPFDQFLAQRILFPFNMADTAFFVPEGKQSRAVAGLYRPVANARPRRVTRKSRSGSRDRRRRDIFRVTSDDAAKVFFRWRGTGFHGIRLFPIPDDADARRRIRGTAPAAFRICSRDDDQSDWIDLDVRLPDSWRQIWTWLRCDDSVQRRGVTVGSYSWGGLYHTFFWVDPEKELVAVLMTQLFPWGDSTLWADFQKVCLHGTIETDDSQYDYASARGPTALMNAAVLRPIHKAPRRTRQAIVQLGGRQMRDLP